MGSRSEASSGRPAVCPVSSSKCKCFRAACRKLQGAASPDEKLCMVAKGTGNTFFMSCIPKTAVLKLLASTGSDSKSHLLPFAADDAADDVPDDYVR